jgi:hypothetical protein
MTGRRAGASVLAPLALSVLACRSAPAPAPSGPSAFSLPLRAAVTTAAELCGNALDDNENGLADEGCGTPTGFIGFSVAWDEPTVDVDLRVIDPNGELAETGRPTGSGLVKERDCPGRESECRGRNVEHVYLERSEVLRGDYRVRVRLVSLGAAEPPVEVRFSARVGQRSHSALLSLERLEQDWETIVRP